MRTNLESLQAHYLKELSDLLNAEHKLVNALPAAIRSAPSPHMQQLLDKHLKETQEHVTRLERILGAYCRVSNFIPSNVPARGPSPSEPGSPTSPRPPGD